MSRWLSYFRIALKKFAEKNGLTLYWRQSDLKHTIAPDALLALTDPKKPEGQNALHYFLEIERAKIGHYVDGEPSIMRKLAKYYAHYNTDQCEKEWEAFRLYRVIVIQRTEERRNYLLRELNGSLNHRMFWLASETGYKTDIGEEIFKTPKDYPEKSYSLRSI
jgi:hypothetical protein